MKVKVNDIIIGERIRIDSGDLLSLQKSIEENGLINPLLISESMELIAGYRRLMCIKKLGWKEVDCKIVKVNSKVQKLDLEADENILRKDFTLDELAVYYKTREELTLTLFQKVWRSLGHFFSFLGNLLRRLMP